jgi:hypothetical protein
LFRDEQPSRMSMKVGDTNKAMKSLNSQVSAKIKNKFSVS